MSTLLSLMLVGLSLGQTPQSVQAFPDVPKTHWAYAAVTELHEKGILKGYPGKFDRSTPRAALFSLIKAINNGDEAVIRELATPEMLEHWTASVKLSYPKIHQRMAALKQASATWKQWANNPMGVEELSWEEFNAKANRLPLGTETSFHRWLHKDVYFGFVQDPSGWKLVSISSMY